MTNTEAQTTEVLSEPVHHLLIWTSFDIRHWSFDGRSTCSWEPSTLAPHQPPMPRFNYVALDARGQESSGLLEAASSNAAISQLRQDGYFPTSVIQEATSSADGKEARRHAMTTVRLTKPRAKKSIALFERKKVKSKLLMIFTRQLATLIDSGLPLLRSLNVLAKQERDKVLKKTINALADSVQSGSTFSDALSLHPRVFNNLYVNMVKAGEVGGVLELVLNRLSEFQEKAAKIKNKVLSAMVYPIIVMVMAVGILVFLLVFIVPRFEVIFHDLLGDKPLPPVTRFVLGVSGAMQHHGLVILGVVVAVGFIYNFIGRTRGGRLAIDAFKLRMPLFGNLNRKTAISRFARTLGTLVTSGVPILQALNITRETAGNSALAL